MYTFLCLEDRSVESNNIIRTTSVNTVNIVKAQSDAISFYICIYLCMHKYINPCIHLYITVI